MDLAGVGGFCGVRGGDDVGRGLCGAIHFRGDKFLAGALKLYGLGILAAAHRTGGLAGKEGPPNSVTGNLKAE